MCFPFFLLQHSPIQVRNNRALRHICRLLQKLFQLFLNIMHMKRADYWQPLHQSREPCAASPVNVFLRSCNT